MKTAFANEEMWVEVELGKKDQDDDNKVIRHLSNRCNDRITIHSIGHFSLKQRPIQDAVIY